MEMGICVYMYVCGHLYSHLCLCSCKCEYNCVHYVWLACRCTWVLRACLCVFVLCSKTYCMRLHSHYNYMCTWLNDVCPFLITCVPSSGVCHLCVD